LEDGSDEICLGSTKLSLFEECGTADVRVLQIDPLRKFTSAGVQLPVDPDGVKNGLLLEPTAVGVDIAGEVSTREIEIVGEHCSTESDRARKGGVGEVDRGPKRSVVEKGRATKMRVCKGHGLLAD